MEVLALTAEARGGLGTRRARALFRQGIIPGVLYGQEVTIPMQLPMAVVKWLIRAVCFIDLTIKGNTYRAILQAKQTHPVSGLPIHFDLLQIVAGHPIVMHIPVELVGKPLGVEKGGLLMQKARRLRVKAHPEKMPEKVSVAVSALDLGQSISVRAVEEAGYTIQDAPHTPIAVVEIPRALRSGKDKEESAEATAA